MNKEDLIGQEFPQNCGDILKIIEKTNLQGKDKSYLFKCKFLKYPYEILLSDFSRIKKGNVNNPLIEENEFIGKEFSQKCGDILKVLEKDTKKKGYYICQFLKYPFKIFSMKKEIINGSVVNPLIEKNEFIGKEFLQNCGDTLRVIEKTNKKQGTNYLYKIQFLKYPIILYVSKQNILKHIVNNPLIEENEFIGNVFFQKEGNFKVLRKTEEKLGEEFLFEGFFLGQNNPTLIKVRKRCIKEGNINNPDLIWKRKDLLEKYLINLNYKPTLIELAKKFFITPTCIGQYINKFELYKYIKYLGGESQAEKDLREYIKQFKKIYNKQYFDKDLNQEIDIYIPDLKLGFEFNGNYWHSELYKNKYYHQEKSLNFKKKNIKLIHIWEWEWIYNKKKIQNFIKSKLGIFDKKIGASKCKIKNLSNKEYQDFCEENHLQNGCGAKVKLGLFYKDELVQIMSFGVPRFTDKYEWEIIRECSKQSYIILGGKEKLWSYFVKNNSPNSVISYCDFSKFTGESYLKLGFKNEGLNQAGFLWYDNKLNCVYWRNPYKHNEMKDKYLKIYDCGQLVFVWKNLQ